MCRLHQEEIVSQEQLMDVLLEARKSLWVHIPMVLVVVLSVVLLMLNCLGCAGACLLSYSLLSGERKPDLVESFFVGFCRIHNVHVHQLCPFHILSSLDFC